jgi:hypothetical protein
LDRLCHGLGVCAIPNAVWWLQIPGANSYQFCMERSIRLEDAWNLGYWGAPVPIERAGFRPRISATPARISASPLPAPVLLISGLCVVAAARVQTVYAAPRYVSAFTSTCSALSDVTPPFWNPFV